MRLAAACLTALLGVSHSLAAQTYWTGDTLVPRIRVSSCALADSVLGPASKNVLKAEVHGTIESASKYHITAGPVKYKDRLPASLILFSESPVGQAVQPGIANIWFYGSIMRAAPDASKPFTILVDDSLSFALGMPPLPRVEGPTPDAVPFSVIVESDVVSAMLHGQKVRVQYLGKSLDIPRYRLEEIEGASRLAMCTRAGQLALK